MEVEGSCLVQKGMVAKAGEGRTGEVGSREKKVEVETFDLRLGSVPFKRRFGGALYLEGDMLDWLEARQVVLSFSSVFRRYRICPHELTRVVATVLSLVTLSVVWRWIACHSATNEM